MKKDKSIWDRNDENDPVMEVFTDFGDRLQNLRGDTSAKAIQDRIAAALEKKYGPERAWEIAFHVSDWNWEFAFLTALHLSPESFSDEDIRRGVEALTIHGVNHAMAATHWAGEPLQDIWELGLKIEPS